MYEKLLLSIKNKLLQSKRTNAELNGKLHQLFQDNIADYEKYASWYSDEHTPVNVTAKYEFENNMIENFKKRMYGENYAIKEH